MNSNKIKWGQVSTFDITFLAVLFRSKLCHVLRPDPNQGGIKSEKEQMEQDTYIWNFNLNIYFK